MSHNVQTTLKKAGLFIDKLVKEIDEFKNPNYAVKTNLAFSNYDKIEKEIKSENERETKEINKEKSESESKSEPESKLKSELKSKLKTDIKESVRIAIYAKLMEFYKKPLELDTSNDLKFPEAVKLIYEHYFDNSKDEFELINEILDKYKGEHNFKTALENYLKSDNKEDKNTLYNDTCMNIEESFKPKDEYDKMPSLTVTEEIAQNFRTYLWLYKYLEKSCFEKSQEEYNTEKEFNKSQEKYNAEKEFNKAKEKIFAICYLYANCLWSLADGKLKFDVDDNDDKMTRDEKLSELRIRTLMDLGRFYIRNFEKISEINKSRTKSVYPHNRAFVAYTKAIKYQHPSQPYWTAVAYSRLADLYSILGEVNFAKDNYENAMKKWLCDIHERGSYQGETIKKITQSTSLYNSFVRTLLRYGKWYIECGKNDTHDFDHAARYLILAIRLENKHAKAYELLTRTMANIWANDKNRKTNNKYLEDNTREVIDMLEKFFNIKSNKPKFKPSKKLEPSKSKPETDKDKYKYDSRGLINEEYLNEEYLVDVTKKIFKKSIDLYKIKESEYKAQVVEKEKQKFDSLTQHIKKESNDKIKNKLIEMLTDSRNLSLEANINRRERNFSKFLREKELKYKSIYGSYFLSMQRWNSYTPTIDAGKAHESKGGGYFIKTSKVGIVIDPGEMINSYLNPENIEVTEHNSSIFYTNHDVSYEPAYIESVISASGHKYLFTKSDAERIIDVHEKPE
ncbi:MAG: hypothetical protein LBM93_10660 [Oscillospiraceae bacterium]|nr:hypothetical protein [Oscillospiraceae bacterium]